MSVMEKRKRFGKNDRLFLGTLALVLAVGAAWFYFSGEKGAVVEISVDGELYGTYSLAQDQDVEIVIGETVTNVLRIQNQKADMITANCPDKLCVHQKAISRQKETIVCLPNKVVVEVIGGDASDVDTVVGG